MKLHLVIADPRRIYREGLRSIFSRDPLIASITEVATIEELKHMLASNAIDAMIVNQSLLTDMSLLPEMHVVIIAAQPDRAVLKQAIAHGVNGYFLDEPDENLLRAALHDERGCVLDPRITNWVFESGRHEMEDEQNGHLTLCEREILVLWKEGKKTGEIASARHISPHTVRTHLRNAARKMKKKEG